MKLQLILHCLKLICVAAVALWIVDLGAHLGIVEYVLRGRYFPARFPDYVGVLLGDLQIAIICGIISLVLGAIASRLLLSRDTLKEATILMSASIAAFIVLTETILIWHFGKAQILVSGAMTVGAGAAVWIGLRVLSKRRIDERWGPGQIVEYVLFPGVVAGFVNLAVANAISGRWQLAAVSIPMALLLIVNAFFVFWLRPGVLRRVLRFVPVAAVVVFAAVTVVRFASYGSSEVAARSQRPGPSGPNIVLIVLDTVRADHLQRYGYSRDTMPLLEKWAANALVFERAVASSGWTSPSHASMFCGLPVSVHGIHYSLVEGRIRTKAFEGISWLPARLAAEGYYCLAVSSNHYAVPQDVDGFERVLIPNRSGWHASTIAAISDRFLPFFKRASERLRWRTPYADAGEIVDIVMRAVPEDVGPMFLFVNFLDAHSPYNPPERALGELGIRPKHFFDRYWGYKTLNRRWDPIPEEILEHLSDLYDGELMWVDIHLDKLLRWIEKRFGGDTIVIVASDHGEDLGENGKVGHSYGLSQALLHVPLFVRAPNLPKGVRADLLNLRGIDRFIYESARRKEAHLESLVRTDDFGVVAERYPYFATVQLFGKEDDRFWVSMFEEELKAVGPSQSGFQLFDVGVAGFDQEVEVFDNESPLFDRVDEYWEKYRDRRIELPDKRTLSEEEIKRLRALGYIK
jgi:hypothetical protein